MKTIILSEMHFLDVNYFLQTLILQFLNVSLYACQMLSTFSNELFGAYHIGTQFGNQTSRRITSNYCNYS